MAWTNGLWTFNGESKKKIGHPAPFPVELPRRCVKLFSYVDDVVLDPFCGSGTTLIAAVSNQRKGIGIDVDKKYCELARKRILDNTASQLELLKTKKK
ncbi:MAG TPA: site-specific DNA-methyltransferase [Anaerolineales bacterium]|nr:site-specific DNA-methyltransferase [Anaerolineales bacterium]